MQGEKKPTCQSCCNCMAWEQEPYLQAQSCCTQESEPEHCTYELAVRCVGERRHTRKSHRWALAKQSVAQPVDFDKLVRPLYQLLNTSPHQRYVTGVSSCPHRPLAIRHPLLHSQEIDIEGNDLSAIKNIAELLCGKLKGNCTLQRIWLTECLPHSMLVNITEALATAESSLEVVK